LIAHRTFPEEIDLSEEDTRVAIFLCRCGEEISSAVDMEELIEFATSLSGVVYVAEVPYLCLNDATEGVKERIKDERANRVIIAGCSAAPYRRLFTEAIRDVGLNPSLLELVDLREQLSGTQQDRKRATEKARSLVSIALEKVKAQNPLPITTQAVERRALIVGGGLSGLTAALSLAEQGFEVHLVEKAPELGGHLRHIYTTLEGGDPQALLQESITKAEANPLVNIHRETEVAEASGYAGNFTVTLSEKGTALDPMKVGTIIIATGSQQYEPSEYLHGQSDGIVTQQELERRLASDDLDPQKLSSVAMIQCVGSRNDERPYCSRICCAQALKNALTLKEKNPEVNVLVLYRDLMSYGFQEEYYTRAREKGVIFINYDLEHEPEVTVGAKGLELQVTEPTLGGSLKIEPDLLVLSAAIVPNDNGLLAQMLGLELTEDGFFKEAEVKFRPVDFLIDGIFVCGLAHSPRNITESVAQAQAAAQRAASILSRERLESGRVVAEVNERRCSGCELCISVCPYNARFKDEDKGVVVVVEALCQGCGACAATCPNSAAKIRGFTDSQLLSIVDAAL
jgi:heterodisulfide reductase subunit A-like polyferredoxin